MNEELKRKVCELISCVFSGANITIDADTEMDQVKEWDSIRHVTIIKKLEDEFGVQFPEEDMFDLVSVRAFVEEIEKLKG